MQHEKRQQPQTIKGGGQTGRQNDNRNRKKYAEPLEKQGEKDVDGKRLKISMGGQ
jgi:hypothetical protein